MENKFLSIFQNPAFPNILDMSDGIVSTEDGCKFHIHRSILAKTSHYFHTLFKIDGNDRRELLITGISGECMCSILCCLYTGDLVVNDLNIVQLLISTNYLLLTDIYMKIKQNVKSCMTDNNCLKIFYAAYLINDQDIMQESKRFIVTRFEKVIADHKSELEDLPANILYEILSSHSLSVFNENTVWEVIVQWTQKNIDGRKSHVSQLLFSLAIGEVDEELASEILHHKIVRNNLYMAELKSMNSSNNFSNKRDMLLQFRQNHSNDFSNTCYHRIPQKIFVITLYDGGIPLPYRLLQINKKSTLYITYDENVDLWCKIVEVSFPVDFMTVIDHDIFIFGQSKQIKFNLNSMDWTPMENFACFGEGIVAIGVCIYFFFRDNYPDYAYGLKVYDTEINVWFNGVPLRDINFMYSVVVIDNGIFVAGYSSHFAELRMKRFDVVTWQWTLLPPPNNRTFTPCVLVAYHKKLYLFGWRRYTERNGNSTEILNAEIFDPETAVWKVLPDFPYECNGRFGATIFNDHLFIYGDFHERKVMWNELNESWQKVENLDDRCLDRYTKFFTIEDASLIRMITKRNRQSQVKLEETGFSFNNT